MSIFDDVQSKATDAINDPEKHAKIEQIAKEKGLTMDEAKEHFMSHNE